MEIINMSRKEIDRFNILTNSTEKYLENYGPKNDTTGKQKAKEYWLSECVTDKSQEYFEKIREDYPQEIEKLRKKLWKHHVIKMAEDDLRLSYVNKETTPAMPDDFTDLESYRKVQKFDSLEVPNHWALPHENSFVNRQLAKVIEEFPGTTEEIIWAKKYILGNVTPEEKKNIPEKYLPQVKIFRQLLWERNLRFIEINAKNEKERAKGQVRALKEFEEMRRRSNQKFFIAATLIVTAVVGFFFSRGGSLRPKFSSIKPQLGVSDETFIVRVVEAISIVFLKLQR